MDTVTVKVSDVAAAVGVDEKVVDVAEQVLSQGLKPTARGESRQTRRRWEAFQKFARAVGLPEADALDALEGRLDETYVTPHEVSHRRIAAAQHVSDKLRKELEKAKAYTENVVDSLINEVGYAPIVPFTPKYEVTPGKDEEWAMLDTGDWHTASCWRSDETGFGEMSSDVIADRIELLTNKVISLVNMHRKTTVIHNLAINFEGDMGENAYLHPSSGVHVDSTNLKAMANNLNMAERMLTSFLGESGFAEVRCYMVRGNHGRNGKKGEQAAEDNWDDLFYCFLAERFKHEPRLRFFISHTPVLAYILPGQESWVHQVAHGNDIPSSLSTPFYGIGRHDAKVVAMLNRAINFSHFGHWHNTGYLDKTWGAVFTNGSVSGTSPHGVSYSLASRPKQTLLGFHPELGNTWMYNIYLDNSRPPEPDANGILTPYMESLQS